MSLSLSLISSYLGDEHRRPRLWPSSNSAFNRSTSGRSRPSTVKLLQNMIKIWCVEDAEIQFSALLKKN